MTINQQSCVNSNPTYEEEDEDLTWQVELIQDRLTCALDDIDRLRENLPFPKFIQAFSALNIVTIILRGVIQTAEERLDQ